MNWEKVSRKSMEEENLQSVITHVVKFTLSTAHQSVSLGKTKMNNLFLMSKNSSSINRIQKNINSKFTGKYNLLVGKKRVFLKV